MKTLANSFDVAIAGAGPAGTSAAIQLALMGARVLLIESKKFPRAKLCGEFISPECLTHFQRLGVADEMNSAGGAAISKTVFYARRGQSVEMPSEWFKGGTHALGLSRSTMDHKLLERAKSAGVVVLEDAHAAGLVWATGSNQERQLVQGLQVKMDETVQAFYASVTVDATGRSRTLARQLDPVTRAGKTKPALVAFKAHLEGARVVQGACEIYSYKRGYGGLSVIEGGLSNLCFITAARDVRRYSSDPETVMREVVMKNSRAAYTLATARVATPWLSVSLEGFGRRTLSPAPGLLTIGDAASFIDPFTGSGMLMALESGQLVADVIGRHLSRLDSDDAMGVIACEYEAEYSKTFRSRFGISALLRRAAFVPRLAEAVVLLCSTSSHLRRRMARATRNGSVPKVSRANS
jgi:flavin-dependent dehydrogenase